MLNYKRVRLLLCNTLMGITLCTALPVRAGFLDAFRSPISNEIMVDALVVATARAATLGAAGAGALYGMYRLGTVRHAAHDGEVVTPGARQDLSGNQLLGDAARVVKASAFLDAARNELLAAQQLGIDARRDRADGAVAAAGSAPVGPVVAGSVILPGAGIDAGDRALLDAVGSRPLRRMASWPPVIVRQEELAEHGQFAAAGGSVRGGVLGAVRRGNERLRLLDDEDGDSSLLEIELDRVSERGNLSSGSSVDGASGVADPGQEPQPLAVPVPVAVAAVVAQGQSSVQTTPLEAAVGLGLSCLERFVRPVVSRTMSRAASVLGRGNNGNDAASVATCVSGSESAHAGSVPADRGGAGAQVQAAAAGTDSVRGGGGGDQEAPIELVIEAICSLQADDDTARRIFDAHKARICERFFGDSEQQVWLRLQGKRAVRQFFFERRESITAQEFEKYARQVIAANIVTPQECDAIYQELFGASRR